MKHSIVLFDGICNLCHNTVRFIYKRDKSDQFRYQSLQSAQAKQALANFNYEDELSSFVLIHNNKLYTKSSAALKMAQLLGFPYSLMGLFWVVPKPIRNAVYSFVAANRYKWFGQQNEVCEFSPEFQSKTKWKK